MSQPDVYADWDAAYVLGSLSVQQRHAYEEHLAECADCRAAVSELAGMPGLLSQLPVAEAMALNDHGAGGPQDTSPVPPSIASMSPPQTRNWTRVIVAASIALALLIGALAGYAIRAATESPDNALPQSSTSRSADLRVAFIPVNKSQLIAVADLIPNSGGTTVQVQCQHAGAPGSGYGNGVTYSLWAVDTNGERHRGDSWTAVDGQLITSNSQFDVPLSKIRSLQIGPADSGDVLMWARV
jgi:RNA polymerase sigma-70 factor (ECF subfamily)